MSEFRLPVQHQPKPLVHCEGFAVAAIGRCMGCGARVFPEPRPQWRTEILLEELRGVERAGLLMDRRLSEKSATTLDEQLRIVAHANPLKFAALFDRNVSRLLPAIPPIPKRHTAIEARGFGGASARPRSRRYAA